MLRPTRQAWTGTKKKEDSPYNGSGRKYRTYALVVFLHPRQNFGWENGRTSDPNRQLDGPKVPAVVEYRPKIMLRKKPDKWEFGRPSRRRNNEMAAVNCIQCVNREGLGVIPFSLSETRQFLPPDQGSVQATVMEMKVSLGRAQASSYDPCYDPTLPHRVMSPLINTRTRVWKSRPEDPRIQLKPKKKKCQQKKEKNAAAAFSSAT